ncbi:MAG: peptide chain release factor N(5)-glutamine methyltransferase, partial [Cyanobacteria bacterium P01_G01_bin.19]
ARKQAIANNIDPNDVDWLLQAVTDLSSLSLRMGLFQDKTIINSLKSLPELDQLWQRRLQNRLPVQYLAETVFWRRFQLKVTPAVLIPRPETELIVDIVREVADSNKSFFSPQQQQNWVDLGTGSGAIALGLADSFPQAKIYGVDSSPAALEVAQENAIALGLDEQIDFCCSNWWDKLERLKGKVTGMISNPPYIPSAEIPKLQLEVTQHEPHSALDGGVDGLDSIRYLVESAPQYLISGGIWLVEIAIAQSDLVVELLNQQGEYDDMKIFSDLNGIERFVLAYRS